MWTVEITLDGYPIPYGLCRCDTADAVAAIVLALCRARDMRPITIRHDPHEPATVPVPPGPWPEEVT